MACVQMQKPKRSLRETGGWGGVGQFRVAQMQGAAVGDRRKNRLLRSVGSRSSKALRDF